MRPEFLQRARHFLDISHLLATGPNKYKSPFGKILEGVFRKEYFTLYTITTLADMVEKDDQLRVIFGGSILDLSRRSLEDMLYMEYINEKGKDKYSKQFFDYIPVEQKDDLGFLKRMGVEIDKEVERIAVEKYDKTPKRLRDGRINWAAQSVEQVIEWFVSQGKLSPSDKDTILRLYIAGNRKNHTSPGDIFDHRMNDWLMGSAERDIELGLMITYGAVIKICLLFLEEIETTNEMKMSIMKCWEDINPKTPQYKQNILNA